MFASHCKKTWPFVRSLCVFSVIVACIPLPSAQAAERAIASQNTEEQEPSRIGVDRMKALYFEAAREGRNDVLESFLKAGLSTEVKDIKGYTPLILAAYNEHPSTVEFLLKNGAQPCAEDKAGNTALMGVAFKGNVEILKRLIKAGCSVNHQNMQGKTALMMSSLFGREEVVKTLLASGADWSLKDNKGNTALSLSRQQGNDTVQKMLVEAEKANHHP